MHLISGDNSKKFTKEDKIYKRNHLQNALINNN